MRFEVLGLPVDALSADEISSCILHSVKTDARITLAHINLHGLYCALRSAPMRALYQASETRVYIDGMPFVWLGKLFGHQVTRSHRNTSVDFLPPILKIFAAQKWPVAFVGSAPEHVASNQEALRRLAPGLDVECFHGHFDMADHGPTSHQALILQRLAAVRPKLLLVGMGMPLQEAWIEQIRASVDVPVIMPLGGFIDYFTHRVAMPPRQFGRWGLEGLWRLAHDPKRLAFRYCVEPVYIIRALLRRGRAT